MSTDWTCESNWTISNGSLINSISFETPFLPTTSNTNNNQHQLLLTKPSPDSSSDVYSETTPCEITITFRQQYEIRQVYVRSSARIYEIYYLPDSLSNDEYLCTVRCCLAAKVEKYEETLNDRNVAAHVEESMEGLNGLQAEITRNNSIDDDGWVKIKDPDSPLLDDIADTPVANFNRNMEKYVEKFFEATAEIADASPCISLKLRFLSLQTTGCVFLEEIYIYGEPVEPAYSNEHARTPQQNSGGNALMATLLPSLLLLSKPGSSNVKNRHLSDITEGLEICRKTEIKGNAEFSQSEANKPVADGIEGSKNVNKENELTITRMERVLDQLVCRVGKIEDLCLRFEANMLKPLTSIELRLERVEQQLEEFKSGSDMYCRRSIYVPEYISDKSERVSLYKDENSDHEFVQCNTSPLTDPETSLNESDVKPLKAVCMDSSLISTQFDDNLTSQDDEYSLEVAPLFSPSLRVTAPEFCIDDDNGEVSNSTSIDDSESVNKGISSSLDNALAMALSKFLSSTSLESPNINETFTIEVHKSPIEDDSRIMSISQFPIIPREIPADFVEGYETEVLEEVGPTQFNLLQDNELRESTLVKDVLQLSLEENYSVNSNSDQMETVASTDLANTSELQYQKGSESGLEDVLKKLTFSEGSKLSVLDVDFVSHEGWSGTSPLEDLLRDEVHELSHLFGMQKNKVKCYCAVDESDGAGILEEKQLVQIDNEESSDSYHLGKDCSNQITSEGLTVTMACNNAGDWDVGLVPESDQSNNPVEDHEEVFFNFPNSHCFKISEGRSEQIHDVGTLKELELAEDLCKPADVPAVGIVDTIDKDFGIFVKYPPCWSLEHLEDICELQM